MNHNNDDWELIREEMEAEAYNRRAARRINGFMAVNNMFLRLFPKDKRDKVMGIEVILMYIPILAFWGYLLYRLIVRH